MTDTPQMIFVNLPVRDLEKSKAFFAALGFTPNLTYTDDKAASFNISDTIMLMLLLEPFFATFINRPIGDARKQAQVILALSSPSRPAVDATLEKVLAAGGSEPTPARDYGFMYQRSFEDLDGHLWEVAHMDGEPG
ncbi:VOC family protein [Pseudomonas sp. K5]|uniref:VOC family protein n=1 Tax=Pseudomonas sp. K5 TaxID=1156313 RepID=UPI00186642B8|nr:VOC family protein [Pseudomonas sp. K5]HDS0924537.1 glyoxalase/bleomycin resistance/extradiol dioxygenase family protein [Stenotrophomonas maltophilia]